MTQNTLTPTDLDKSIDIKQMMPTELTTLHTQIHAVWEGLMQGRYFNDWTFEDARRIHTDILTRMNQESIKHIMLNSTLDTGMSDTQKKISDMLKKQNIDSSERKDLIQTIDKQQQQIDAMLKNKATLEEDMSKIKDLLSQDKKMNSGEKDNLLTVIAKQQKEIGDVIARETDIKSSINNVQDLLREGKQLREEEKANLQNALVKQGEQIAKVLNNLSVVEEFKKLHQVETESRKEIINSILQKQTEAEERSNKQIELLAKLQEEQSKRHEESVKTVNKKQEEDKQASEEREKKLKEEKELKISLAEIREKVLTVDKVQSDFVGVLGINKEGYVTSREIGILIRQTGRNVSIEEAVLNSLSNIRDRIKFYYLNTEELDKFDSYVPLYNMALGKVDKWEPRILRFEKEKLLAKQNAGEIPSHEEKKDINNLPKEVKSNILNLLKFAKGHGCPSCGSKVIRLVGFMEAGNVAKFGCVDCQVLWVIKKKEEAEGYATYNYEAADNEQLAKKEWDKVYPNLLKAEQKLYQKLKTVFESMKNKYLSNYKKLAIGDDELLLALEGELIDTAYDGEVQVAKDLKRPVPKALNPDAVKFIKAHSLKLSGDITKEVLENVRLQIEAGISEGAGVREIKNRIASVFDKGVQVKVPAKVVNGNVVTKEYTRYLSAEVRARAISQTETIRAFNYGRYETIKGIDAITGWRFEASADERTCEICNGLDGQEFAKNDDSNMPPNPHVSCRCTFSYVFSKKKQEEPKPKQKFKMQNLDKYKVEIPNLEDNDTQVMTLDTDIKDIGLDKGWIEHGSQLPHLKEYFMHGKKINGRWICTDGKLLKKAESETPYVLSGQVHVPPKYFSALPKGLMARTPSELRWWSEGLQGFDAWKKIEQARIKLFDKGEAYVEVDLTAELKKMAKAIEPMKVENKISLFLGRYKKHKYALSVDNMKAVRLETWSGKKPKFKLPLPISGTALTEGAWRGMSGEWVYYGPTIVAKSAPLLAGTQIRQDHNDDDPHKVVGWITQGKAGKDEKGKVAALYKGLIFDYATAKDIWDKKIRKVSASPFVQEEVDGVKGLIATDIQKYDEMSVLTGNNPACKGATVVAG